MGRVSTVSICAVACLSSCLLMAREASAASVFYDQKVTSGGTVATSMVLVKDEMFRVEATSEGTTAIILRNPSGIYHYVPKEQTAVTRSAVDALPGPLEGFEDYNIQLDLPVEDSVFQLPPGVNVMTVGDPMTMPDLKEAAE